MHLLSMLPRPSLLLPEGSVRRLLSTGFMGGMWSRGPKFSCTAEYGLSALGADVDTGTGANIGTTTDAMPSNDNRGSPSEGGVRGDAGFPSRDNKASSIDTLSISITTMDAVVVAPTLLVNGHTNGVGVESENVGDDSFGRSSQPESVGIRSFWEACQSPASRWSTLLSLRTAQLAFVACTCFHMLR